jgi:hypothetical protein
MEIVYQAVVRGHGTSFVRLQWPRWMRPGEGEEVNFGASL